MSKIHKIMSIDPASNSSGWAIADSTGAILASGTILTPKGSLLPFKLWFIFTESLTIMKKHKPNFCFIEQMSKNTHFAVNMAVGVFLAVCGSLKIQATADVVPGQWKAFYGIRVPKGESKVFYVRAAFKENFPELEEYVQSDDEREAVLMARYLIKGRGV